MSEPNMTLEELTKLEAIMPPPGKCPHGTEPARTGRGLKNLCSICFQEAKAKLAETTPDTHEA